MKKSIEELILARRPKANQAPPTGTKREVAKLEFLLRGAAYIPAPANGATMEIPHLSIPLLGGRKEIPPVKTAALGMPPPIM